MSEQQGTASLSVTTLLAEVEKLEDDETWARLAHERMQRNRASKFGELKIAIQAGGTTGNKLRDYIACTQDRFDPKIITAYESINGMLRGCTGELMLITYTENVYLHGNHTRAEPGFACCMLSDDKLDFSRVGGETVSFYTCKYPTNRSYVVRADSKHCMKEDLPYVAEVSLMVMQIAQIGGYSGPMKSQQFEDLKLIVGNAAVNEWLTIHRPDLPFMVLADYAGQLVLTGE